MSEFNLATAEKSALKMYAINELNLNLPLTMNEDTMRQKIIDECGKLNIPTPTARVEIKSLKNKNLNYVTVNIARQTSPGDHGVGVAPIFVGFQGTGYMIPRGINIDIPEPLVEILQHAVQDIVTQDSESAEIYHSDLLTHPFQIIGKAA